MTQKILVTGATGYVGASVAHQLLKKGYLVRAVSRNPKKTAAFAAKYVQYKNQLEFASVDLANPSSFKEALKGVDGVFHVAAPMLNKYESDIKKDFVDPAVEGMIGLLDGASQTPSVKRIVITSAAAVLLDDDKDPRTYVYTEKDWNPITIESALAATKRNELVSFFNAKDQEAFLGYKVAKTYSEKAAFKYVEEKKPHFDIVTIIPPWILGPSDQAIESAEDLSESIKVPNSYLWDQKAVPDAIPSVFVDVRDLAHVHILAYESPKASNQRYIASGAPFSWQQIVDIANKNFPGKVNTSEKRNDKPAPFYYNFSSAKLEKDLAFKCRDKLEDTAVDMIGQLIELKQQGKI